MSYITVEGTYYHLGHFIMDSMLRYPDSICQIDAATGEQETKASVLSRSIRLARCLRKLGLQPGDVLALGGRNHLDLHIPYYSALMIGLPIAGVDPLFKYDEIKTVFKLAKPKIAFCQYETYNDYQQAVKDLGLETIIITFDKGECTMKNFVEANEDKTTEEFKPTNFDGNKIYAWLVGSSGTTGNIKLAAYTHKPIIDTIDSFRAFKLNEKYENKPALNLSPVQWMSGYFNAVTAPHVNQIKVQTSAPITVEHVIEMINKYKPMTTAVGPSMVSHILKSEKECDFTCFDLITLTGSKIHTDVLTKLRSRLRKDAVLMEAYGQTESLGPVLMPAPNGPVGNCGKLIPTVAIKLVNPDTGKEIEEPNVAGELWTKGPRFSEYYNDPESTAAAISEDGWFKTGDLLYRDENDFYYFVDRIKTLINSRDYHVLPAALEEVIHSHADVIDVAVTGMPHPDDIERPVACVVKRAGSNLTTQDVKNLVASKLSVNKQLTGGVVFMDELPQTSTGKVARAKLKQLVQSLRIE